MVDSVSSTNENKKQSVGKVLGTTAGVGYGCYGLKKMNDKFKQFDEFVKNDSVKAALESKNVDSIVDAIKNSKFNEKLKNSYVKAFERTKDLKSFKNETIEGIIKGFTDTNVRTPAKIINVSLCVLTGLGIGAIVDKIINRNKGE